jgi:translation initiation factor 2B subunit (eIF-2B alpha/beta/delta family)
MKTFEERAKEIGKRVRFIAALGKFSKVVPYTLEKFEVANSADDVIHLTYGENYVTLKVSDDVPIVYTLKYRMGENQKKIDDLADGWIYNSYPCWSDYDRNLGPETVFTIMVTPEHPNDTGDHNREEIERTLYCIIAAIESVATGK